MALFRCKMCGGTLEISNNESVAVCEYCGTQQTLPKLNDDRRVNLYDRANHFRRNNEYDKAMGIYEQILTEEFTDAEAYWSLVLCRYGIEYVEDPATHKRMPTVNRAQFTSVFDDDNYRSALQYADSSQRVIYEQEAKAINEIQKGILAISQQEEPFDVFICYKETDHNGRRTPDSVLANDLYHQLTQEGFKVFFSRITLEDKLGSAYEPYIFAALNSAKVMVVLGTKPEFFQAVWVRNEWSRYLALIRQGQKKVLIPAYKDMDPYNLPEEFFHLQAQDMSKLGFMQDLIRGIQKITGAGTPAAVPQKQESSSGAATVAPLLRRVFLFLEDRDWKSANEYCERVLDLNPECAQAYLGKLMATLHVPKQELLKNEKAPFDDTAAYKRVMRFADEELRATLEGCIEHIRTRNENQRLADAYSSATAIMNDATDEAVLNKAVNIFESIIHYRDSTQLAVQCRQKIELLPLIRTYKKAADLYENSIFLRQMEEAAQLFESISHYQDAADRAKQAREKAEDIRKDQILQGAKSQFASQRIGHVEEAIRRLESIPGWKDADEQLVRFRKRLEEMQLQQEELRAKQEAERAELERWAEQARLETQRIAKRNKVIAAISAGVIVFGIAASLLIIKVIIPTLRYNAAVKLMESGEYSQAITAFEAMARYKDSEVQIKQCRYEIALDLMDSGEYSQAIAGFEELKNYEDSAEMAEACAAAMLDEAYSNASALEESGDPMQAYLIFSSLEGYKDSAARAEQLRANGCLCNTIAAGAEHIVSLKNDGTVVCSGNNHYYQCDTQDWTDVISVTAGSRNTVGLRADGTVLVAGYIANRQLNARQWSGIIAVSTGSTHVVGLKADGTVVSTDTFTEEWTDIVAISAGDYHTVGLKKDGTVVASGNNDFGQCNVEEWTDIVAISAGHSHTVGLKADGTVVSAGGTQYGRSNVSQWTDIIAIAAGTYHTVGLKADGTVVATGENKRGICEVDGWTGIIAIDAGENHTMGLYADGSVVVIGKHYDGPWDQVLNWTDVRIP